MNAVTVDRDECDACPAEAHVQAFVYAEMKSGNTVSYCSHHGTQIHGRADTASRHRHRLQTPVPLMKLLIGIAAGVTIMILWHLLGWPWIGWIFTRILPETPADWTPRDRTWIKGVLQP